MMLGSGEILLAGTCLMNDDALDDPNVPGGLSIHVSVVCSGWFGESGTPILLAISVCRAAQIPTHLQARRKGGLARDHMIPSPSLVTSIDKTPEFGLCLNMKGNK